MYDSQAPLRRPKRTRISGFTGGNPTTANDASTETNGPRPVPPDRPGRSTGSVFAVNVFEATGVRPVWLTPAPRPTKEEQWQKPHASARHARRRTRTTESGRTAEARVMAPGEAATEPIGSRAVPIHGSSASPDDARSGHAARHRATTPDSGNERTAGRAEPSRTPRSLTERPSHGRTNPPQSANETCPFDFPSSHEGRGNRPCGWDSRFDGDCHDTVRTSRSSTALSTRRPGGRPDRIGVRPMSSAVHIRGIR